MKIRHLLFNGKSITLFAATIYMFALTFSIPVAAALDAVKQAPLATAGGPTDTDGDGIDDSSDNCLFVPNSLQRDTDGDGIGNSCDPDLDQSCVVNFVDISIFSGLFLGTDANADFNGDGRVNFLDYRVMVEAFLAAPGPSGIANDCSGRLVLSGVIGNSPIANAAVIAQVDATATGGGISEFITTAGADGSYALSIAGDNDDFVTLLATGVSAQNFVAYKSVVGSVNNLIAAGGNDGSVNSTEVAALDVTPLTTAYEVLAREAEGAPIDTDVVNDQIAMKVDASQLLRLAATLESVVVNAGLQLPSGFANMAALLDNTAQREKFELFTYIDFKPTLDAAVASTVANNSAAYDATDMPSAVYNTRINNLFNISGSSIVFDSLTMSAQYTSYDGSVALPWTIAPDGSVIMNLSTPVLIAEFFNVSIEDPNNPGNLIQTTQQVFLEEVTLNRFRDGGLADHVNIFSRTFTLFPEFPSIPAVVSEGTAEIGNANISVEENTSLAFEAADLINNGIALDYYHQDNNSQGTSLANRGYDVLQFFTGGTGVTSRRGFTFDWVILSNGELDITFANGDNNRIRRLFEEDTEVFNALLFSPLLGVGAEGAQRTIMITPDSTLGFDVSTSEFKSYRHALATSATLSYDGTVFDFVLSDATVACRNPDNPTSTWSWEVVDGRIELFRAFNFDPTAFFYRTWQPLRQSGDKYFVNETLQTSFDGTPQVNVAQTPGRLNSYTQVHDAFGNGRPILGNDNFSTSVNTPVNIILSDVFANDIDPEGDELLLRDPISFVGSAGGTLENVDFIAINPYYLQYTPPVGFVGTETFLYSASDIACRGDTPPTATISISVN